MKIFKDKSHGEKKIYLDKYKIKAKPIYPQSNKTLKTPGLNIQMKTKQQRKTTLEKNECHYKKDQTPENPQKDGKKNIFLKEKLP